MSGPVITRPKLETVVADVVEKALRTSSAHDTGAARAMKAVQAAADVSEDPRIAKSFEPISRLQSQNLQGIAVMAIAPLVLVIARKLGFELAEGDGAVIATSLVSLAAGAYAWWGRENTTRPLK